MIGRFPWDPFPANAPEPGGSDPFLSSIYRAAVVGGDAYRGVRSALRIDGGVLRVGNRFVAEGRYREVGFVAVGHAANSMALAALHVFGDRLTQGFLAGPEPAPTVLPFRSVVVADGWGGASVAPEVVEAAREIATGLRPNDLFLLLLSGGAQRALLVPPPNASATEFAAGIEELHHLGASGAELARVARVLGDGGVGGRLLRGPVAADVQCLLVDRGDGPVAVGGGPTYPLVPEEVDSAQATAQRSSKLAGLVAPPPSSASALAAKPGLRPVIVSAPEDALRSAADAVVDKGWSARMGILGLRERGEAAAERFLSRTEEVLAAERLDAGRRSKGLAVFATTTLDLPEGAVVGPDCEAFLSRALALGRRREMTVGLLGTAGPTGPAPAFAGAAIGAPGAPEASSAPAGLARRLAMKTGVTDVGLLAVALLPTPGGGSSRRDRSG